MEDNVDYNALGQACDTSWGRSSTPKTASYSVKFKMTGDMLIATYVAVVNFGSEREMISMKRLYSEESKRVLKEVISNVKSKYKELTDKTLKLKETSSTDSLEIIGFAVHNPKRTAYYRYEVLFEVN